MNLTQRITAQARAITVLVALVALPLASGCSVQTSVDVTGTAPAAASHLWLTADEVWLATSADTLPESTAGWQKFTLPTPVTFDLATTTAAGLVQAATGEKLPAGTYRQLHLVLEDSADAVSAAAQALGLTYNAELSFTDASGTLVTVPLEFPVPEAGLTVPINLTVSGGLGGLSNLQASSSTAATSSNTGTDTSDTSTDITDTTTGTPTDTTSTTPTSTTSGTSTSATTTSLAVTIDAARDVVSYSLGTTTAYILSPILRADDESTSGAISGSIDVSALPATHAPVFVSAETTDATQTHHVVVQRVLVGADGSFSLYPLPVATQGSQTYDLVIASAGAQTVIIRAVPVSAGPASSPTMVQSTPITLTPASTVYADLSTQGPLLTAGTRVDFFETVAAAGEIPYLIDGTAVDPLTRRLPGDAFALSAGAMSVGAYASGGTITLASAPALEGQGGYVVGTEGLFRTDTLDVKSSVLSGSVSAPSLVFAPSPALASGAVAGTLSVSIAASNTSLDSGFITVSAGGRIVDTADISKLLQTGGGTATIGGIPAGSVLAPNGGPAYQVAVRAWSSSDPAGTITRAAAPNSVNLGDSAAVSLTIQVL